MLEREKTLGDGGRDSEGMEKNKTVRDPGCVYACARVYAQGV